MSTSVNELKKMRKSLGFSQVEAANALNISRRSYQNYEYKGESQDINKAYEEIYEALSALNIFDKEHGILTIKSIKRRATTIFKQCKKITCVYLFGSYSRGEATTKSDIDFLVLGEDLSLFDLGGLQQDLAKEFNKDVDVVTLSSISGNNQFLSEILTKGVKIYVKVPA